MAEVILNGMLIRSSAYRNISFTKGEFNTVEYDSTYSIIKVTYTSGKLNSQLNLPEITVIKEESLSIEGVYQIDLDYIIINGIKFHELKHKVNVTQVIIKGPIETQLFDQEPSGVNIVINTEDTDMTADEYVQFVNNSKLVYCEVFDSESFRITNFTAVNFSHPRFNYKFNNIGPYSNDVIFTDETIIIDGFLDYLETQYPNYKFKTRPVSQNDENLELTDEDSPNETIFYNAYLSNEDGGLNTRPLPNPVYDTYRNAVIDVRMEYVTDDFNSLMKFREDFIMQREFSNKRNFKYKDSGDVIWDAEVWWKSESGNEVNTKPSMYPEIAKLDLHAFKFKAEVLGIICRKKLNPNIVAEVIISNISEYQTIKWIRRKDG